MKRIIKSINHKDNYHIPGSDRFDRYDGVLIEYEDGTASFFGIKDGQQCCESYGYISWQEDTDFNDYIGAEVRNISFVESSGNKEFIDWIGDNGIGTGIDINDCMFFDVETNKGDLNFAVYNHHNGYYGHRVWYAEITPEKFAVIDSSYL